MNSPVHPVEITEKKNNMFFFYSARSDYTISVRPKKADLSGLKYLCVMGQYMKTEPITRHIGINL